MRPLWVSIKENADEYKYFYHMTEEAKAIKEDCYLE